jgi:hypothetical protein
MTHADLQDDQVREIVNGDSGNSTSLAMATQQGPALSLPHKELHRYAEYGRGKSLASFTASFDSLKSDVPRPAEAAVPVVPRPKTQTREEHTQN